MEPLIKHIHHQVSLTAEMQQKVVEAFTRISVAKKSIILKEGSYCKDLYFVEKGCLRLYFIDERGREQITHFAIENWWLTDYLAFDTETTAAFSIQAVENCTLLHINRVDLHKLTTDIPLMDRYFRLNLQRAFGAAQRRIMMMYEKSKEDYFYEFNERHPDFVQRVPQYMLASFLGLTPEYLSELRKKSR
jgi:CRP-like cAMP-binding protein